MAEIYSRPYEDGDGGFFVFEDKPGLIEFKIDDGEDSWMSDGLSLEELRALRDALTARLEQGE